MTFEWAGKNSPEILTNVFEVKQPNWSVARWLLPFPESLLRRTLRFGPVAVAFCTADDYLLALAAVPVVLQWYSFLLVVALVHCQPLRESNAKTKH